MKLSFWIFPEPILYHSKTKGRVYGRLKGKCPSYFHYCLGSRAEKCELSDGTKKNK